MKVQIVCTLVALAALTLASCVPDTPTEVPTWPTASSPPSVTPLPTYQPAESTSEPMQEPPATEASKPEGDETGVVASAGWGQPTERVITAIGMRFLLPEGFQGRPTDLDGQHAYAFRDDPNLQVGVEWVLLEPPMEPEAALLPSPSRVLASEPVELDWGSGRLVTLELLGVADEGEAAPVVGATEQLLVVRTDDGGRLGVSVYLRALEMDQLEANADLLDEVIASVRFEE